MNKKFDTIVQHDLNEYLQVNVVDMPILVITTKIPY